MTAGSHRECPSCGTAGGIHHQGAWIWRKCPSTDCGLLWLDPLPEADAVSRAYDGYFTHRDPAPPPPVSFRHSLGRFGGRAIARLARVEPERAKLRLMCLGGVSPGRLLDVGCGDGRETMRFRDLGWKVQGVDTDPLAAERARARCGLDVRVGSLESSRLAPETFDAVILSHVLEHALDPLGLLREALRLLEPGGRLVAITPNGASLGHSVFGSSWLGLDPPRHRQVFSPPSLGRLARQAGANRLRVWTSAAHAERYARGSLAVGRGEGPGGPSPVRDAIVSHAFQLLASLVAAVTDGRGEDCVL
ncbi:MAG: class I SAM-dependent methyltransferase, partial [Candidatus Binatia bacterium]